jgi:diacylglycerol O-acyltransferase
MAGGNALALGQAMVPTGEMALPDRFGVIHERLASTRTERLLSAFDGVAAVVNLLPTTVLLATGERTTAGIDFVCSNVRAAPFDLYIAGAQMEANYPVGPLGGTAFNLTTMSYRGTLFMGLHVDAGAVREPAALREQLVTAYADLLAAAGVTG